MNHNQTPKPLGGVEPKGIGSGDLFGTPLMEVTDIEKLRKIAEDLWQLLDDIDTASDAFKPCEINPESYRAYYKYVERKQAQRGDSLESDGYKLYLPNNPSETANQ